MLKTGEMLKMLKIERAYPQKMLKIGEMLKMLKMLKVFWVLPPPPLLGSFLKNASHRGNVKNVKNLKGIPTKKCFPLGKC